MRPKKFIPEKDIKGIETMKKEGKSTREIADYLKKHGIEVSHATIAARLHGIS